MSDKQRLFDILSRIWRQQWLALAEHCAGAALGSDPEHLHRLRVALRQIRALLRAFKNELPDVEGRRFIAEFKWLAAATGAVRDLDVQLASLRAWAADNGSQAEAALLPVIKLLINEREIAQRQLRRVLASKRYQRLQAHWLSFVELLPQFHTVDTAPARLLVRLKVAKQSLHLLQGGLVIKRTTAPSDLHRLRIRGKRLRYLLESFAPLFARHKGYRPYLRALKSLQQALGDYRDNDLASARVTLLLEYPEAWPQTLPWLKAWRGELNSRQRRARSAIGPAIAAFNLACRDLPG